MLVLLPSPLFSVLPASATAAQAGPSPGVDPADYLALAGQIAGLLAALVPVASAFRETRAARRRHRLPSDTPVSPLRLTGFESTQPSYPTPGEIATSRRTYLIAGGLGVLLALPCLYIVLTDPRIRIVDPDHPSDATELDAQLFLLPSIGGGLLAWWGFRLGGQLWSHKDGEPVVSHHVRVEVVGDAETLLARCQATFIAFGALRAEGTTVSVKRTSDVLQTARFVGRLRRDEEVTIDVTHVTDSCYSVTLTSSSFKPRLRTKRFSQDVELLAASILT
jgi:hypothetical protein